MGGIEKVMMNVGGKFWTRQNEMVEELEELDYVLLENVLKSVHGSGSFRGSEGPGQPGPPR